MSKLKWLLIFVVSVAIAALGFWVSSENSQAVKPRLLGIELWELNFGVWLLIAFFAGGFIGYLISLISVIPLKAGKARAERKLIKKEQEITRLRSSVGD